MMSRTNRHHNIDSDGGVIGLTILVGLLLLVMIILDGCASSARMEKSTCPAAVVVEPPGSVPEDWTIEDRRALAAAHSGCRRHYSPEHCLVKFEKRGPLNYHAICALPK